MIAGHTRSAHALRVQHADEGLYSLYLDGLRLVDEQLGQIAQ